MAAEAQGVPLLVDEVGEPGLIVPRALLAATAAATVLGGAIAAAGHFGEGGARGVLPGPRLGGSVPDPS